MISKGILLLLYYKKSCENTIDTKMLNFIFELLLLYNFMEIIDMLWLIGALNKIECYSQYTWYV